MLEPDECDGSAPFLKKAHDEGIDEGVEFEREKPITQGIKAHRATTFSPTIACSITFASSYQISDDYLHSLFHGDVSVQEFSIGSRKFPERVVFVIGMDVEVLAEEVDGRNIPGRFWPSHSLVA